MEWIIPMIAGLLLDICGSFLIIRPFIRLYKKKATLYNNEIDLLNAELNIFENLIHCLEPRDEFYAGSAISDLYLKSDLYYILNDHASHNFEKQDIVYNKLTQELSDISLIKWGFGLLSSGFILILIASLINYY